MAAEFKLLKSHEVSSRVTSEALSCSRNPVRPGELVVRSVLLLEDSDFIAASSVALSEDLLEATAQ